MITYRNKAPRGWYGYVYLLKCGDQYKIGFSITPRKRLRQLRTGSPFPIEVEHSLRTSAYKQIEKKLHYMFAEKRSSGEWFKLEPEDVAYIKSLNPSGRSPEEQADSDAQDAVYRAKEDEIKNEARKKQMEPIHCGLASGAGETSWIAE